jgi:pimeloyl-ACP methyl ester carboxylesterase
MAVAYAPFVLPELAVARLALTSFEVLSDAWQEWRRPCTDDEDPVAPPPQRRLALLVGGLGSTDTDADVDHVDTASLGYAPTDVVRFSYAGGRTPGSTGAPAGVPSNPYDAADSQQDLYLSAERLADLVEQVAASAPGAPIDLIAHSQGGIVARLALEELERRGSVDAVGLLATLATPHEGADLATAARAVGLTGGGQLVLKGLGAVAGLDPFAPTIEQLSETGDLIAHLEDTPLPDGVEAISIAGRTDPVVPAPRTQLDGATSVVIPTLNPLTAHGDLPGDPRTTRELTLALAGAPPGCRTMVESLLDQATGQVIGGAEDAAGAGAAAELLALELEAPFRWP